MIRVLHVIGSLNYGGSQALVLSLLKEARKKGVVFDLIIDKDNELQLKHEFEKLGSKIYCLPELKWNNIFKYIKQWDDFFHKHPQYEIIHGQVRSTASIYLKIAKKNGLYTIIHSHSTTAGKGIKAIIKKILQFFIKYVADYYLACSKESGIWLYGKKIVKNKNYKILNNGIDCYKYKYNEKVRKQFRDKLGITTKDFIIGHVGRFHWLKNQIFLIYILKEAKKINRNAKLILVGNTVDETYEKIKNTIKENDLEENVIIYGPTNDVSKIYNAMDCFVFPSIHEGLPISVVEAQTNGLKCYISDSISKEVIISDNIKYISLKQSAEEWANLIINSNNSRIKNIYNKKYDIKYSAEWLTDFYNNILRNRRKNETIVRN